MTSGGRLDRLLDAGRHASLEELPALAEQHGAAAGLDDVTIYLADLQEEVLRPLAGRDGGTPEEGALRIEGSLAGRAYQNLRAEHGTEPGDSWWLPLRNGGERLGVLHARTRGGANARQALESLAVVVALWLVSRRPYSDMYARLVRTRPMSVVAEMQWQLMPPRTFSGREVSVSAVLEPAYETSGDAFDYAVAGDTLHFAIFDAMGHDASAGLTVNLAVSAYRRHRRNCDGLLATGEAIERTLIEEFGADRFVTAILADLNAVTGEMSWISRGHPNPVIIRDGRWTAPLECPPAHPLGTDLGLTAAVCRAQLEPGDRVVLYTDGIIEARDPEGREFGLGGFLDFIVRQHADDLPVSETLRRLIHTLLRRNERFLDDATVLFVEWRGHAQVDRDDRVNSSF
jgi:serine phosphatase RsbU (regulator of sigma subunit)